MPRPDFPKTILDFQRRFSTDEACYEYVRDSRWPDGFRCPSCDHPDAYDRKDRWGVECASCGKITSVTAGTVMHKSKVPLCSWLWAAWLLVTSKRGVSALEIQRQLGLGSYKTAFTMLHKLRHAMVSPDRTLLRGAVEVDVSMFGPHGDPVQVLIIGAVEARDRGPARCRFRVIPEEDAENAQGFIRDVVEPESTVQTDGHQAYRTLTGYRHEVQVVGKGYGRGEVLPYYHTAVANLRAFLGGTPHGAWRPKHLQAYLNEFCFRYNRRGNLAAAFQTLLGLTSKVGTLAYDDLHADEPPHRNPARRRARA